MNAEQSKKMKRNYHRLMDTHLMSDFRLRLLCWLVSIEVEEKKKSKKGIASNNKSFLYDYNSLTLSSSSSLWMHSRLTVIIHS